MCATFLPLVWNAGVHATEILATLLTVTIVLLIFLAIDRRTKGFTLGAYAMVGLATGVLSLVRPEYALAVVPIAIGLFVNERLDPSTDRLRQIGILMVGFVFSDAIVTRLVRATHGDASGVRGAAWLWA